MANLTWELETVTGELDEELYCLRSKLRALDARIVEACRARLEIPEDAAARLGRWGGEVTALVGEAEGARSARLRLEQMRRRLKDSLARLNDQPLALLPDSQEPPIEQPQFWP